jgi:undecaprenyl-diphosphatase
LYWDAIVLGIIEGITEFLPISSTGHLLIAEQWLGARSDMFNIVIQAGAILAVTFIYWRRLLELATNWRDFLITAALGFIAKKMGLEMPETVTPVAWALVIGGFWMIAAEWLAERRPENSRITWPVAIIVGLAQVVAGVFPGTSRSGTTIFAAMLVGTNNRSAATEFTFLVGIPTMYAASAYEIYSYFDEGAVGQEDWTALGVAFVVSMITAFVAVKWLLGYIRANKFTLFAVYRIIFGAALLGAAAMGWVA